MILELGTTKILRTRYDNTPELYQSISDKLVDITSRSNKVPWFILNGSCSFHNVEDEGRQLYKWEELKDLVVFLKAAMREYLDSVSIKEEDAAVAGMWANRYPPGTFVARHNHNHLKKEEHIVIGALYYIRKDEDAGSLYVDIPGYGEYNADMKEGDVVIFQSSLDHWTVPNNSNTDKYVIGMELVVGEKGMTINEI